MHTTLKNLTICVILGNRATAYRQLVLLEQMEKDNSIGLVIFLTGSLLTDKFQEVREGIKRNYKKVYNIPLKYTSTLTSMATSAVSIQEFLIQSFQIVKPDLCIAIADRWEQLAFGLVTSLFNIPLAHIQGGEISGNIDDKIRNVLTMLSEVHFPSHSYASERLKSLHCSNVFNYGCPSIDLIKECNIRRSTDSSNYFICMFHPHTKEIEDMPRQLEVLAEAVQLFTKRTGDKCYWFLNNDDPGAKYINLKEGHNIEFVDNLVGSDYLRLLADARLIIGNSSSGIREASYLGVPSLTVGNRQENRVAGPNSYTIDLLSSGNIVELMTNISNTPTHKTDMFGTGEASRRILNKLKEIYR